jgi:hypothetical protein
MSQQTMQSLVDSLCRCFGSTPISHHDLMDQLDSLSLQQQQQRQHQHQQQQDPGGASSSRQRSSSYSSATRLRDPFRVRKQVTPPTPEMKKRTRSLQLQDKQWDALFSTATAGAAANSPPTSSSSSPPGPQDPETPKSSNHYQRSANVPSHRSGAYAGEEDEEDDDVDVDNGIGFSAVEQAKAVAEAKRMAASASAVAGANASANLSAAASAATKVGGGGGAGSSKGGGKKKGSMHKRKRSSSGTRDDIFRSKRNSSSWGGGSHGGGGGAGGGANRRKSHGPFGLGGDGRHPFAAYCGGEMGVIGVDGESSGGKLPSNPNAAVNRISRFLSNHPVFASSLCFATPVTDSADEAEYDDDVDDYNSNELLDGDNGNGNNADEMTSVVSGDNTLNTAEDTITSTLYYETTTLAGLKQTSPPMPLFNSFCVDERDDIHRIISTNSHMTSNRSHHHQQHSALKQSVRRPLTGSAGGSPAATESRARQSPSPKGTPTRPPSSNGSTLTPPMLRLSPKRHSAAAEIMTFSRPAGGSHPGTPRSAALVYADSSSPPPPVQTPPQTPPPTTTSTSRIAAGPAHGRFHHHHRLDDGIPATVSSSDSSRSQNRLG